MIRSNRDQIISELIMLHALMFMFLEAILLVLYLPTGGYGNEICRAGIRSTTMPGYFVPVI
jgi:hypothetical protein